MLEVEQHNNKYYLSFREVDKFNVYNAKKDEKTNTKTPGQVELKSQYLLQTERIRNENRGYSWHSMVYLTILFEYKA